MKEISLRTMICHNCSNVWEYDLPLSRNSTCPQCDADCKVCKNCKFFDEKSSNECKETEAEPVRDKTQRTFCGYFFPNQKTPTPTEDSSDPMNKLKELFGDKKTQNKVESPLSSLENLFKKDK